jgi:hypothetical protein
MFHACKSNYAGFQYTQSEARTETNICGYLITESVPSYVIVMALMCVLWISDQHMQSKNKE